MKTIKIILKLSSLLAIPFLMIGCASNNSGSNANVTAANSSYYWNNSLCYSYTTGSNVDTSYCSSSSSDYYTNNGLCYSSSTGSQVSTSYCNSNYYLSNGACYSYTTGKNVDTSYCTTSDDYYWNGNYCYSSSSGIAVSTSYCSNSGSSNTNQCNGTYYYIYYNNFVPVTCNGSNCRGYQLYNTSGQIVYCQ